MSKAITRPNAADMVLAVQNYRTSLESLMHVGKTILDTPNIEEQSALAFSVLAENVLEDAGHQEDLEIIEGVDEPAAKVELIMQDVLQPRIMESEKIETALADKAANEVPTPFTTSNAMTESPAMESLKQQAEVLALYHDNIQLAKTLVSMEGADIDAIRPAVMQTLSKFSGQVDVLGVSMEEVGQTQVLGELSDAVSRVEKLVEKARESVDDKIGAQLDEDVSMTTVDADTEELDGDSDGEDIDSDDSIDGEVGEDDLEEDDDLELEEDDEHPLEDIPLSDVEHDDGEEDDGEAIEEESEDDLDEDGDSDDSEEGDGGDLEELEEDDLDEGEGEPEESEDLDVEEEVEYEEVEDDEEIELEDDDEDLQDDEESNDQDDDESEEEEGESSDDDDLELEDDSGESDGVDTEEEDDDDAVTHISLDDDDEIELEEDDD